MPQKNVLLYTKTAYPQYLNELLVSILIQKDFSLAARIISDFILSDQENSAFQAEYINWLMHLSDVMKVLAAIDIEEHLNYFKTLPASKDAEELVGKLNGAIFTFAGNGNKQQYISATLRAVETALSLWRLAIYHFLEALSVIIPISRDYLEFFKKSDVMRQLEKMKDGLDKFSVGENEGQVPCIAAAG